MCYNFTQTSSEIAGMNDSTSTVFRYADTKRVFLIEKTLLQPFINTATPIKEPCLVIITDFTFQSIIALLTYEGCHSNNGGSLNC